VRIDTLKIDCPYCGARFIPTWRKEEFIFQETQTECPSCGNTITDEDLEVDEVEEEEDY